MADSDDVLVPIDGPLETRDFVLLDRHFNRAWIGSRHMYLDNTAPREKRDAPYEGWLKCKIVHGRGYSLLTPDILFLDTEPLTWIQPLHFMPNMFAKDHEAIEGMLWLDVSCGHTLGIRFNKSDLILRYDEGSELYRCRINGPERLNEYVTGVGRWDQGERPLIMLFHHTTSDAKQGILSSGCFRPSLWNIRGNKKLRNVGYVYFTCLPRLDCEECLHQVAMSGAGMMYLRRDPAPPPPLFSGGDPNEPARLDLEVYRADLRDRTATVDIWIDPGYLAPSHLLRHYDGSRQIWYEVVAPFTYRIGIEKDATLPLLTPSMCLDYGHVRRFNYAVVGEAWTLSGLAAPFEEEDTTSIAKIEPSGQHGSLLESWFAHANTDRFSAIDTILAEFVEQQGGAGPAQARPDPQGPAITNEAVEVNRLPVRVGNSRYDIRMFQSGGAFYVAVFQAEHQIGPVFPIRAGDITNFAVQDGAGIAALREFLELLRTHEESGEPHGDSE